ncbi:MAG: DUF3783 domain-containing protein [Oscillospiraceae bacterium]|nr:DUF3783 domain-containing protein [Oscillospiraceae bacterium]
MEPTVLVYQMELQRLKKLKAAAKVIQIRVKKVPTVRYLHPVGREAGLDLPEPRETYQGPELPAEMIVLCNLSEGAQERLLAALRQMGTVERKAVLTDTNSKWSGIRLFAELNREHLQFSQLQ